MARRWWATREPGSDTLLMSAASGDTVLDDGTAIGHRVIGELLLARGADVNLQHAGHGFTALMYAAFQPGTMDMLRLLLAAGARLDLRDNDGSPLCSWPRQRAMRRALV